MPISAIKTDRNKEKKIKIFGRKDFLKTSGLAKEDKNK